MRIKQRCMWAAAALVAHGAVATRFAGPKSGGLDFGWEPINCPNISYAAPIAPPSIAICCILIFLIFGGIQASPAALLQDLAFRCLMQRRSDCSKATP